MVSITKKNSMQVQNLQTRRTAIKSSLFGLIVVSIPNVLYAKANVETAKNYDPDNDIFHRYPSIDDEIVAEVVGASHFNFDRVKELVNNRPELARATWDWAFGDWETALGAASHVGRRDIAKFLMDNGARPDIFTFAMFGQYEVIKAMIDSTPGIETTDGPHGISLLRHARAGLRSNYGITLTEEEKDNSNKLISYLEKLGTADKKVVNIEMTPEDKDKFIGDYKYGEGENDGVSIRLNMRKDLALGKMGKTGGSLFQKAPNVFTYNGISSVEVSFSIENDVVNSLTLVEPDLTLKAIKVQ